MNYNEINKEIFDDFLKYKKKFSVIIGGRKILMTEDYYLFFLKKIKEGLDNWLDRARHIYDKDRYNKIMSNLVKWLKNK